jgi:hypothetical protein
MVQFTMWIYQDNPVTEVPDGYQGFIYLIENITTKKKYIGKKIFLNKKTNYRKGKRNVHSLVDSGWINYTGSNAPLNLEMATIGKENFTFTILYLCRTKAEMNYLETREIFNQDALLRDDYWNEWVTCKITKMHLQKCREYLLQKVT